MKTSKYLALGLLITSLALAGGQGTQAVNPTTGLPIAPALTKFNLDFPGGTPAQLVKAVQKATGNPLNAIIPTEDADIQLPPLKMNDVVTPQLFAALEAASRKTVAVQNGMFGNSYAQFSTDYGFKTADGPFSDTSIWYFHAEKPSLPTVISSEKVCRFYSMEVFLNRGFTVDDITTAIQTGWKMAGMSAPPELNYHKETRLLIAFGEESELNTINSVLQSLPSSNTTRTEIDNLNDQIRKLSVQVNQLQKTISNAAPTPAVAPAEKSGK